jgi:shikimate kinase
MRASGKSTVGRALAQKIKRSFVDLDVETLAAFRDCRSTSEVWRRHGESRFRAAESAALQRVLGSSGQVIALGGGTPMIPHCERLVDQQRRAGLLLAVYLQAGAQLLRQRLSIDAGDRPALRGVDAIEEIETIMGEREPIFRRLADITLDAALPPQEQVELIMQALGADGQSR